MLRRIAFGIGSLFVIAALVIGIIVLVQFARMNQQLASPAPVENADQLAHLAYWTTATEKDRWPEMSQFTIVACHDDPDADGNAKVVFLVGEDIKTSDLKLIYFNGYSGPWNDEVKAQIITEIQDSVRPHVPGFTLKTVDVMNVSN